MSLVDQAVRLLRTHWRNPTTLAQELYAMFTAPDAASQDAPMTIANPSGQAPYLQLPNYTPGNSLINITGKGGAPIGDISLQGDNLVFQPAGTGNLPAPSGTVPYKPGTTVPTIIGGGSAVVAGQVISGSGASYVVGLYPQGPSGQQSKQVNATQLQIDPGATIPPGTWAALWQQTDGNWYMQVPVIIMVGP